MARIDGAQHLVVAPVGSILMYGAVAAPTGWLLCNGAAVSRTGIYVNLFAAIGTAFGVGDGTTTFNVPDFQGIFPRGAGTSTKLSNANGVAFAGTLGTYQNDKMQGHKHEFEFSRTANVLNGANRSSFDSTANNLLAILNPISDGTNGIPRTGTETNPANLGVNFIIKY